MIMEDYAVHTLVCDDVIKHRNQITSESKHEFLLAGDCVSTRYLHQLMREYSKKYPDIIFSIIGELVDYEELYKRYYENGLSQFAQSRICFEEFNRKLLK